ncbi:MAG: carbonic anhydrase family protein [Gammaproteobacteria bacterium]|nr:carbonic anhydrase family protein [Gammaproteobacteria bacterium]
MGKINVICLFFLMVLTMPALAMSNIDEKKTMPTDPQLWGYADEHPSATWGRDYPLCRQGGYQAPIDLQSSSATVRPLPSLKFHMVSDGVWLLNNGYAAEVTFNQHSDTITIGSEYYFLQELHFHTPSENRIDGQIYPMELHWVYESHGKWVVIAVLVKAGGANPALSQLLPYLPKEKGKVDISAMKIDFNQLLPKQRSAYYRFEGSLTTPPCSHHLTWYLLKQPIYASQQQIAKLHRYFGDNVRPIQPMNKRPIDSRNIERF